MALTTGRSISSAALTRFSRPRRSVTASSWSRVSASKARSSDGVARLARHTNYEVNGASGLGHNTPLQVLALAPRLGGMAVSRSPTLNPT